MLGENTAKAWFIDLVLVDGTAIALGARWAMLIRIFFLPFFFWTALDGDNSSMQERMSIDNDATKKLRAAGYRRL